MKQPSNKVLVTSFINAAPNDYYLIRDELLRRLEELDNLRCCGNCKHYTMTQKCYNMRPGAYCPKWEPDGLTREKRSG